MTNVRKRLLLSLALVTFLLIFGACIAPLQEPLPDQAADPVVTAVPTEESDDKSGSDSSANIDSAEDSMSDDGVIVYGIHQTPSILNPFLRMQTVDGEIASLIEEGLVEVNSDGEYYPVLATETPTLDNGLVSDDGLSVTYNLRDDVVWSDGEPFTCEDVRFTWEAVTHPESGAVNRSGYDRIDSVICEDDLTAIVSFSEFYVPYLSLFSAILPQHAVGKPGEMQDWAYNLRPIGTGPFKLQEATYDDDKGHDREIVLTANELYRGYPELPKTNTIVIRLLPGLDAGKAALSRGEIDILWNVTEQDASDYQGVPDVIVHAEAGTGSERLVLNLADPTLDATDDPTGNPHPLLGDVRVRQAVELGINKQLIIDELLHNETSVGTSELSSGPFACDIAPSQYNPDAAMALLEEAGFIDEDGDGIRECVGCDLAEEGTPLRLRFQTTINNPLRDATQQLIDEMMADIGIEFRVLNVPSNVLFDTWEAGAERKHGNFDILMYTSHEGVDPQSQMEATFASRNMPTAANGGIGYNYSRWINEEVDTALNLAGGSSDPEMRKAEYQAICDAVATEAPIIYLYDGTDIHLTSDAVEGFIVNPWANQSWNAQEWEKLQ